MTLFNRGQRGFTLIELLVVIAIIGILSSVVIASLATARNKGADTAVKADLASVRNQMELFYDTGSTYASACTNATIASMVTAATNASGVASDPAVCYSSATAWIVAGPLKSQDVFGTGSGQDYYCLDSVGAAKVVTAKPTAVGACP